MIYLSDHGLFFVHIPKNGGFSVAKALTQAARPSFAPLATDFGVDEATAAKPVFDHPELGPIHPVHLPLWLMAEHLPATWTAFERAKSFALARDPRDRFISALMQRLKEYRGAGAIRADEPVVADEAAAVCDWLAARTRFADDEYAHFIRQVDFTDLDGVRRVDAVFPVQAMDAVQGWVAEQTGLVLEIGHEHARRQPKPWARAIRPIARFAGRRLMPAAVRRALHPLWVSSAAFSNAAGGYGEINLGDDVERFVTEYYAADVELFRDAKRRVDQAADRAA